MESINYSLDFGDHHEQLETIFYFFRVESINCLLDFGDKRNAGLCLRDTAMRALTTQLFISWGVNPLAEMS